MGAVNADVWRRLTWVEPSWFENDWGADQRQQGDPKHTISREELGFEGQSVEYCGLYVGPPDSQREPEWEWKPESRNRKSAKVVASSWRGQLWPTILKNQRFRRITEFSLPTAAAIAMPALLQLPPIAPRSHKLYAVTTERHQSHAGQPPANRVRRLRQDGSRWPGAWPRPQRGPTFPTRSATIGRSRDRFRLVEIFQTRLAKLTGDAKMLIWNR